MIAIFFIFFSFGEVLMGEKDFKIIEMMLKENKQCTPFVVINIIFESFVIKQNILTLFQFCFIPPGSLMQLRGSQTL